MLTDFSNALIFLLVGFGFVFGSLLLGGRLRPNAPFREKLIPYECGEIPTTPAWVNFNIRFYLFAMLFIIFDVEMTLMFPVAAVFRDWVAEGKGVLALAEIFLFVGILALGLVYAWRKGDLEWVRLGLVSDQSPVIPNVKEGSSLLP